MSIIYNVTIEPTRKENLFQVTWHDVGKNTQDSFTRETEITQEEIQWLWQHSQYQLEIGSKLYRFLDGDTHNFMQALNYADCQAEKLQVRLRTCKQTADWPFELLAKDNTFLLPHRLHLVRTVSDWGAGKNIAPGNHPLKLLFMACSALDVKPELDFEKEEEAIFHITEKLAVDMEVEDTGSLEGLRGKLEPEQYDVVHLSGHANIDKSGRPYFVMEDETGYQHNVFPGELWNEALVENPPRLLFLSGCRTGETPDSPDSTEVVSFARALIEKYNVPAVLGWGRSVSDKEASHAGKMIFHELSRGKSILEAVQRARYELMKSFPDSNKPAWPMLRLFSSGMPLIPIVAKEQKRQPKPRRMKYVYLQNSQVKVLAEGFVGRRRQIQTGLRTLRQDYDKVGLLLLGTGGLGKSCLAGKICERFDDHTLIIVHGRFNAITLEQALTDAFIKAQDETGQKTLSQEMEMKDKLANFCASSFKEKNYLLLLDDFEQNLEGADKGQPGSLLPEAANLLKALLHYLPFSGKMTQLIITGRYEFSLSEQDRDLVDQRLEKVWLSGLRKVEQHKKAQLLENIFNYKEQAAVPHLLSAGHGNPRLMEWLDVLVGQMVQTEVPQLLEAVKGKKEDFIREHVIRKLLLQGGKEFELFLRWFSIYRRPVLGKGVCYVMEKAGLAGWKELLRKGMGLTLVEHDQVRKHYQVTPLLREELLKNPKEIVSCHEAALAYYKKESDAFVALDRVAANNEYNKITDQLDSIDPIITEELIFHALGCGQESTASFVGGVLITHLGNRIAAAEALRIGLWILEEKKKECCTGNDAFLLNTIAYTYSFFADHHKVIHYSRQALSIFRRVFGTRHPNVTIALNSLGMAYSSLGNNQEAIRYYREALDITGKSGAKDQPETSLLLNNLGTAYNELGDYPKAIHYFKRALSICKKVFSQEHQSSLRILNNLAAAYDDLGDYPKAIDYYKQVLAISSKIYDEKHPNISTVMNNLGSIYNKLGDYPKAAGYLEQALFIDRALHGEEHPDAARELYNLGLCFKALADYPKAIDYFEQALTIWKKTCGQEHPQAATAMSSLGLAWSNRGEHKKAIEYFQQALRIDRAAYGENHPGLATTLNNLGTAYRTIGDYTEAIDNYEQALNMWKKFHKENHPQVATGLNNLGEALISSGDPKKAIRYLQQALVILKATFEEEHPNIAGTLNNLGLAYKALAQYSKAIEYLEQALTLWKKIYGPKHPKIAVAMNNLGEARRILGEPRKAGEYYQQALDILKEVYGETHQDVATVLNNQGLALQALGDYRKAIEYFEKAFDILKGGYGETHPHVAAALNNLGSAWYDLGDHRKTIEYFEKALSIKRSVLGEGHPEVALDLNNLGLACYELEDYSRAIEYYKQAHTIFQAVYGDEHPDTVTVLSNLGMAWDALNQFENDAEVNRRKYNE